MRKKKRIRCDRCKFKGKCSAERWVRKQDIIPDNCPDSIVNQINKLKEEDI